MHIPHPVSPDSPPGPIALSAEKEISEESPECSSGGVSGRPTAILVLGMHRSGTSAVTRTMGLLGADLPSHLMAPAAGDNDTGFWESVDVYHLNDEILASGGSSWDDWRPFSTDWYRSAAAAEFRSRAQEIVRRDFPHSALFVLKDPRICRLVPFWREAMNELGAETKYVIPLRNPLEVAASLRRRDGLSLPSSLLVWLRHVLEAEAATRGHPRAFPTYDQLLADWRSVVSSLADSLRLSWPGLSGAAEREIDNFLGSRYRHHAIPWPEPEGRPEVSPWVTTTYRCLLQLSGDGESEEVRAVLDAVRGELDRACDTFSLVLSEDEAALREARNAARELRLQQEGQEADVTRLRHEVATQSGRISQLEAANNAQAQHARALQSALEEKTSRVAELESALTRQGETLGHAAADRWALATRLSVLQSSAAWQLAYPLRWVEHRLPRLAQRVASGRQIAGFAMTIGVGETRRLRYASRSILRAGLFDDASYAGGNVDVVLCGLSPLWHWLTAGWREGRDPHPLFDTSWYLEQYPDVAAAGVNPLVHYLQFGAAEGRDPHPLFDSSWYLGRHPDVAAAGINPLAHYLRSGAAEGRDPHPRFFTSWYLEQYPDIAAAGINPLVHYVTSGVAEGRACSPGGPGGQPSRTAG